MLKVYLPSQYDLLLHDTRYMWITTTSTVATILLLFQYQPHHLTSAQILSKDEIIDILDEVYKDYSGHHWTVQDGWDNKYDLHPCDWHGIVCNEDSQVVKIVLSNNNLSGTTSMSIFDLPHLTELDISDNPNAQFSFADFPSDNEKLTRLTLSNINLHNGLDGVENLNPNHFKGLDISSNNIAGSIPDALYALTKLDILYLDRNKLTGSISTQIGQLENLKSIDLFGNYLTGTVPYEIANLKSVEYFEISQNSLHGTIPWHHIQDNWSALRGLFVHHNVPGFTGTVPELSNLSYLREVYLGHNSFTGTIPSSFLQGVDSNTSDVIKIHMESNQINGGIPESLGRFNRLDLRVENNKITSLPSSLCSKSNWMIDPNDPNGEGLVAKYGCDAIMCAPGLGNIEGREVSTDTPCHLCGENNIHYGTTQCDAAAQEDLERETLQILYQTCEGSKWFRQGGWMDDSVPVCQWDGIGCNEQSGLVESLYLGANNVIGPLPNEIFTNLPHLRMINLYSNPLGSFDFDGIANADRLDTLILDSTGLKSVEGIGAAPALTVVNLRFNQLSDNDTLSEISKLSKLEYLDLGDNLLGGKVSSSTFENMSKLHRLHLGRNRFEGSIPSLHSNRSLKHVDFSFNKFSGSIPGDFMELAQASTGLSVNLASNRLTGSIPLSLTRFDELEIYLRDNKMKGNIHNEICAQKGWNGGDVGDYKCDAIMCPVGTFSEVGRRTDDFKCSDCSKAKTLGSTSC